MVTSMSDKQYRKFKRLHLKQRGCILCLKQPGALHDYHSDRIETRSQLIKLLHDRNQFNTNDVSIVFDWLEESGCSSCGKGLEEYCRRQELKTWKQSLYRIKKNGETTLFHLFPLLFLIVKIIIFNKINYCC